MTKLIEHLRRRIERIPARVGAVAICMVSLCCTLFGLFLTLNIVLVTDSDGNRQMLFTTAENPQQLMEVSGIGEKKLEELRDYITVSNGA